ncbi:MAG TPA: aspartate/glutamate racemase family protein [Acidimicrobiia bacterium]|nr:aspartate/glutamate racemase family protein [Acidimicrobiia bacterium]
MIGVFDSGVGGLAVLRETRVLLPRADIVYLADQGNAPYGSRTLSEVRRFAEETTGRLVDRGARTVVIACNTASAAALGHLRRRHPEIAFVGMEPAVKPAVAATRSGVVGVLATPTTFSARVFDDLVGRFSAGIDVIAHPCPGWAQAVEEGWPDAGVAITEHLATLLAAGVDTLVIACTHYSFLADAIARSAPGVTVIDPAAAVARQVARVADPAGSGSTTYLTTGDPARFAAQIERLLGIRVESAAVH